MPDLSTEDTAPASTPVVVAMGNDHAGAPHASASFGAFESKSFVLDLSQAGSWVEADFWHPGADAYTLTVTPACAGCSGSLSVASGANQSRAFGTAMIIVYNDVVAFYSWHKGEIFGVEIQNQDIAQLQKQVFELLWYQAKEPGTIIKSRKN